MEEIKIEKEQTEKIVDKKSVKEKRKYNFLFTSTIISSVVLVMFLWPFVGAVVKQAVSINDTIQDIVPNLPSENDEQLLFFEKWKWYQKLNDPAKWNYEEFAAPVLRKIEESVAAYNDNYHITIRMPIDFVENGARLSYTIDAEVDGNIAHGFLENEFDIQEILGRDSEEENILYSSKIEFYRVLENDKVTTYVSKDGENWFFKEGVVFNEGHVLFDINSKMGKIDAQDADWFPMRMPSFSDDGNEKERIYTTVRHPSGTNIFTDGDFLYQDCDSWNELNIIADANSYLPEMFLIMFSANVHEDKLQEYFYELDDPILKKICESEINFAPAYIFYPEDYGKMDIGLPKKLENAKPVDSFIELFADLEPLLNEYVVKSEWR